MSTRKTATAPPLETHPTSKLKSERIQGTVEKAPVATFPHGSSALERVGPAEIAELLAELPGLRFDPERPSFHVRIPSGVAPVEVPMGDGLTVATHLAAWVEVRLGEGAEGWTKARLEAVRDVHRRFASAAAR